MDPNNVRRLQQAFEGDKPDREVKLDDIKQFLRLAASEHHLSALDVDAVANSIIDDGYTSAHMISEMDKDDLVSVGMLRAHAKLVVRYLNGVDPPNGVQVIPQALPSVHADPAVIAAAVAAAVTGLKKADRLKTHDGLVTVSAVREWALEHAELSKEMMPAVSDAIRDIRSDPSIDVAPLLLDADFARMDTAYAHRVRTSLSEDQMDDMGGADATSAVSIVQSVLKYVVRSQQEIYIAHYTAFTELGPTVKPEATKDRFRLFQDRLTEVRYHPSFELKIAIKVLARVLQCDTFMSNSVMGEWERSVKDQKALSAVISEVRRELAIPVAKYVKPSKDKSSDGYGSHDRDSGRGGGNSSRNRDGRNSGNGGKWQTRSSGGGNGGGRWSSRENRSQSSGNSSHANDGLCTAFKTYGECSYGSRCRFRHDTSKPAGIHQIVATQFDRQFKRVANMLEDQRGEMMREFDSRLEDQRDEEMRAVAQYALEYGRDSARSGGQSGEAPLVAHVKSKTQRQVVREKTPSYAKLSSDRAKEVRSTASARKMNVGPVLDGATAFDVCKQSDCKYAKSVSVLESLVMFSTVSADGSASKTAHIETPLVDIPESIVVPTAHDSLVSHATVHKAGWDIVYTSGKCALVKGEEVHGAVPDKGMFRLPMLDDTAKSDEQVMSALSKARKYWMRVEFERVKRHLRRAHRPKDPDCRTCSEALIEKPPSTRCAQDDKKTGSERGLVLGMDYVVGLPADKDGNTGVLVLVAAGAGVGKAVKVRTRSGTEAKQCYVDCSALILREYPVGTKIARVHSDCEKSLIAGPLLEHLKSEGVWPTETAGYDSNGNAVVESRIKQLSRGVRAVLLDCTGGRGRYKEVWGDAYEHVCDVINHTSHSGEKTPIQKSGGVPIDMDGSDIHCFGAEVLVWVTKERRGGKLDMPGRFAYWAGRSDKIVNGHKIVFIEWNDRTKSYDLSDTMHVRSVVVNEARFPLRMVPQQGCDGTEFKEFVDLFDPKSVTDDTYQVKAVVDHRFKDIGPRSKGGRRRKQLEYLVHWKGYTKREATWEPAHHMKDAEETVLKYTKKHNVVYF